MKNRNTARYVIATALEELNVTLGIPMSFDVQVAARDRSYDDSCSHYGGDDWDCDDDDRDYDDCDDEDLEQGWQHRQS